jgi:hypothetical protein
MKLNEAKTEGVETAHNVRRYTTPKPKIEDHIKI